MDDVPIPIRRQILRDLAQVWMNTRYQTTIELRIQLVLERTLGRDVTHARQALLDRLRDCAVALELLQAELAALDPPAA
jgi:hypothetical protein